MAVQKHYSKVSFSRYKPVFVADTVIPASGRLVYRGRHERRSKYSGQINADLRPHWPGGRSGACGGVYLRAPNVRIPDR